MEAKQLDQFLTQLTENPMTFVPVKEKPNPNDLANQITHYIFLGGYDGRIQQFCKLNKINRVLNVGAQLYPVGPDVVYKRVEVADKLDENISKYFQECTEFIMKAVKAKERILVHCQGGISRAPTILTALLQVCFPKTSVDQIIKQLKERRPQVNPNPNFMRQLYAFEVECKNVHLRDLLPKICPNYNLRELSDSTKKNESETSKSV